MIRKFLLLVLFCGSVYSQTSADIKKYKNTANSIVRKALVEEKGYMLLGELSHFGSRLSGSPNYYEAVEWAKDRMNDLGLANVRLQKIMGPHWVRGGDEILEVAAENDVNRTFSIAALGKSVGTADTSIIAGIIEVTGFDDLELKKDYVKNKIVFYNTPYDRGEINTFRAYGKAVQYRVFGASRAAKYGAKAVIIRSVDSKIDNVPHTGVMLYDKDFPKIPAAAIANRDAEYLSSTLSVNPRLKLRLKLSCKNLPDTSAYNIIGEIKGTEFPDEIIVIGGHFDSWDKGFGMHDDGAPCIQTMEAIYLLKTLGIQPKRTIRCVLFADEEISGRGAIKYAELAAADSTVKHIAAIESDRGAFTPRGFSVKTDSVSLGKMLLWLPVLNEASIDWIRPGGSGADVAKIKGTKALLGYVPDGQRYFDLHHSDNDIFETVHPREMELGSAAIAIMALLLSDFGL